MKAQPVKVRKISNSEWYIKGEHHSNLVTNLETFEKPLKWPNPSTFPEGKPFYLHGAAHVDIALNYASLKEATEAIQNLNDKFETKLARYYAHL